MTNLLYMQDFNIFECESKIVEVIKNENDTFTIILDQTVFYPQGGGQPFDKGKIINDSGIFLVDEVRYADGFVKHTGKFESGSFNNNDTVKCIVDKERRILHSKLHSAGHIVDIAVQNLNLNWIPGKGYHFPEGPYVEYSGSPDFDKDKLKTEIENICNQLIEQGCETKIVFVNKDELKKIYKFDLGNIPSDKPTRVVMYGNIAIPCGGTHVKNINEIKKMIIRKVKIEKANIRVAYNIL